MTTTDDARTMLDRVGGRDAVADVVDQFYDAVLADDRLSPYFVGVPMNVQRGRLTDALTMVLGGEDAQRRYTNVEHLRERLRLAHHPYDITDAHYDRVVEHLAAVCDANGVPDDIVETLAGVAEEVRSDIVTA